MRLHTQPPDSSRLRWLGLCVPGAAIPTYQPVCRARAKNGIFTLLTRNATKINKREKERERTHTTFSPRESCTGFSITRHMQTHTHTKLGKRLRGRVDKSVNINPRLIDSISRAACQTCKSETLSISDLRVRMT